MKINHITQSISEAANPAQQAAIAVNMKRAHKKPKRVEEAFHDHWKDKYFKPANGRLESLKKIYRIKTDDKSYNVKAETEQQAREIIEKHAPGCNIVSVKFIKNLMTEISNDTLKSYQQKVSADTMKNKLDPTKRSPEKRNRSVSGFAKAHNRLEKGVAEDSDPCWDNYKQVGMKKKNGRKVPNCVPKESSNYGDLDEAFNLEEEIKKLDEKSAAWQKKSGKSKSGGLNQKGVNSYRREHPGSKLQTAVTTKPSKLKPGSKDAKRRKSFCARMSGVKGPMKDEHGKPTRKALSLRKWNC